jgi:DNA-binding MarR family transcriptional regulator
VSALAQQAAGLVAAVAAQQRAQVAEAGLAEAVKRVGGKLAVVMVAELEARPDRGVSLIADALGMRPQRVQDCLMRLVKRGLVERREVPLKNARGAERLALVYRCTGGARG